MLCRRPIEDELVIADCNRQSTERESSFKCATHQSNGKHYHRGMPRGTAPGDDAEPKYESDKSPRSARGARTRARWIEAARTVFERDGYMGARINDISAEAGTAAGSFYVYFNEKFEIFAAVMEEVKDEMLHPHVYDATASASPAEMIAASNRAYLVSYKRNAGLMRALEQGAVNDERIRALRSSRAEAFTQRNARGIRELQDRGLADPNLDPVLAAQAVAAMVSRMAYGWFALDGRHGIEKLSNTLTRLWCNALRIPIDPPA